MVVNHSLYSRPEYKLVVVNKKVRQSEIDAELGPAWHASVKSVI